MPLVAHGYQPVKQSPNAWEKINPGFDDRDLKTIFGAKPRNQFFSQEPKLKYFKIVSEILSKHAEKWIVMFWDAESHLPIDMEKAQNYVYSYLKTQLPEEEIKSSIVFIKKSSSGDPITPKWMVYHCMGHALFEKRSPAFQEGQEILKAVRNFIAKTANDPDMFGGDDPGTHSFAARFLPFASARASHELTKALGNPRNVLPGSPERANYQKWQARSIQDSDELIYELFAQYIKTGKVTFLNTDRSRENVPQKDDFHHPAHFKSMVADENDLKQISDFCTNIIKQGLQKCVGHILID